MVTRKMGILAAASLVMAMFAGCGQKQVATAPTGDVEISSISGELTEQANREFSAQYFWGVGQGTSNSESAARQIAQDQAFQDLAARVKQSIDAATKRIMMNDPSGDALEAAVQRSITNIEGSITNTLIQKQRQTFNSETGRRTVYILMTSPKDQVLEAAKQQMLASQELQQMQRTLNLSNVVEQILSGE